MAREFRTNNKSEDSLAKVFLNSEDDFIYINVKDATIFDRFAELLQWLEKKEADLREQEKNSKDYAVRDENGDIVDVDVDEFLRCSSLRSCTPEEGELFNNEFKAYQSILQKEESSGKEESPVSG